MSNGFHALDGAIIVGYLAALSGIGFYFYRKQNSLDDFVKGGRQLGWLPIGLSLMAAVNSGFDYIGGPAVVYAFGMIYVSLCLSWIFVFPWVAKISLPFYQRLDVYSAYEYLERRFDVSVRCLASAIFVMWRVGWMAAALYVPCLAVHVAIGKPPQPSISQMVIILGAVVTVYTMLGGMKAVLWTDMIQFCVMFGGLFATLWFIVSQVPGGVAGAYESVANAGKLNLTAHIPDMAHAGFLEKIRLYFTEQMTFIGYIVVVTLGRLSMYTGDQVAIQRFQTMKSVKEAKNAMIVNAISDVVWTFFLAFVGLALFAYYLQAGHPKGMQNDNILPFFMAEHFPTGLIGLVIAAIFAASLSSVDAAINATTSIVVVDFYDRLVKGSVRPVENLSEKDQRRQVLVSRLINVVLGILVIVIGANIPRLGEIYQAANKILGAFFGPLFGIFVLGMFSGKTHSAGVVIGALAGLGTSCYVSFFSSISWQWPSPAGIFVTLIVGYLASRIIPVKPQVEPPLTFRRVMEMPERPNKP